MNTAHSSIATRLKVGIFTLIGLGFIAGITIYVNDKPYWWRSCQLVKISVEDATGLKSKSPVRSLGIDIGYLQTVSLSETHVSLGICITAPVEVLPTTKAYIRGEGFLGDKFVELKPIKYLGPQVDPDSKANKSTGKKVSYFADEVLNWASSVFGSQVVYASATPETAQAQTASAPEKTGSTKSTNQTPGQPGREIPVGEQGQDVEQLLNQVSDLTEEVSGVATNIKESFNPEQMRKTMQKLDTTLQNLEKASRTITPEGGLSQIAQRTLLKLEGAIEQLENLTTRMNKGEGSVGRLLNDPVYAQELEKAVKNINQLLNRFGEVRFVVDIGASQIPAYNGGRGWFNVAIWPRENRYYLLGIAIDPRGRITNLAVTTTVGGASQTTQTRVVEQTGILFTAMFGKVFFNRVDLALGALYGDGAASLGLRLGPHGYEDRIVLKNDFYFRTAGSSLDDRISISAQPVQGLYLLAGLESVYRHPTNNRLIYFFGAGITFTDDDIKLLFALR